MIPRTKQRTPELRARVLDAATRIVTTHGAGGLTARRLADAAGTSPAAVYELFGDKRGVVRALFFAGFARLAEALADVAETDDPVADLEALARAYRGFLIGHPGLALIMFSRPFAEFDPAPEEEAAGAAVRARLVEAVRRAPLDGRPDDIALVALALIEGLAAAEVSQRLGSSPATVERRWTAGIRALIVGFGH